MTYGGFLALFLGLPLVLLAAAYRMWLTRTVGLTLITVIVLAVVYTGPWDSATVANGVWSYGPTKVMGVLIGHVPLEEYIFYALQVLLVGGVTAIVLNRTRS